MSTQKPKKTAMLSVRIDKQTRADLEALASSHDRSVAHFVQKMLAEGLAARKKPSKKKPPAP